MAGLWSAPGRKALSPWNICLIRVSLYSDYACELSSQSCLTLFNPLNRSLPGSSHQKMRWLDSMSLSKLRELVMDREASHDAVHGVAKSWTWLSDWTELQYIVSGIIVVQLLSCVNSLQAHGWQHTRLSCLSLPPGICSSSCLVSQWCHLTISSSVAPFSSCTWSFPASGSFPVGQLFISDGQNIGVPGSASVLPMNI